MQFWCKKKDCQKIRIFLKNCQMILILHLTPISSIFPPCKDLQNQRLTMLLGTLSHSPFSSLHFHSNSSLKRVVPISAKIARSRVSPSLSFLSQRLAHGGSSNAPKPLPTDSPVLAPPPSSSPTDDFFYSYRIKKRTGVFPDGSPQLRPFNPDDTRAIFRSFSISQLANSAFLFYMCSFPSVMERLIKYQNLSLKKLAKFKYDPKTYVEKAKGDWLLRLTKRLYYPLFTGGETMEECVRTSTIFQKNGVRLVIDLSTEETEEAHLWDLNAQNKVDLAKNLAQNFKGSVRFMPIKLTCLTSSSLFEKINHIIQSNMDSQLPLPKVDDATILSNLNEREQKLFQDCMKRLRQIIDTCKSNQIGVWLDAETYHKQPALNLFARQLMKEYNVNQQVHVYNTYQMYLKDSYYWLLYDLETAQINSASMGIKLVRGAYMEYEKKYSKLENKPYPIWPTKEETDKNYDKGLILAMNQIQAYRSGVPDTRNVGVAVCSHNRRSLQKALQLMSDRDIPRNCFDVNFAQLKGMADNLTFGLSLSGYNVCKLLPYGPFEEVWPYLIRRIHENQDILNATATEKKLYAKEIKRRLLSV
ncbi:putative proline dehydrogenase 2 [Reticulomyxa filosa]|uniref:Proline dehydrogenase n=1 Tax=Reticulomyxa filosa TaxID=46433 RepID=X6PEJ3_RETFI|nr:putative proline dehydrogenase 2 [Reticulomyxa filosa]|eukprot:ETO36646.1 putative proline dehydrogenase 2 [Reticulomyxa filosa]